MNDDLFVPSFLRGYFGKNMIEQIATAELLLHEKHAVPEHDRWTGRGVDVYVSLIVEPIEDRILGSGVFCLMRFELFDENLRANARALVMSEPSTVHLISIYTFIHAHCICELFPPFWGELCGGTWRHGTCTAIVAIGRIVRLVVRKALAHLASCGDVCGDFCGQRKV